MRRPRPAFRRTVAQTGTLKREDIAYDANGNRTSIERRFVKGQVEADTRS